MLSLQKIREDLKEIRYYYSKQKVFERASKTIIASSVAEKAEKYNQAIKNAPIRLYEFYVSLYINNNTQETLAYDWDCSTENIKQFNKRLCKFLQSVLD